VDVLRDLVYARSVATVTFAGALGRAEITVDVAGPERLLDVCDAAGAPVAFSCRDGNCATCRVEVLAGIDLLEPARAEERDVLDRLSAAANQRLACQAVVGAGEGLIRIRWGS
jgi:ferredoxin